MKLSLSLPSNCPQAPAPRRNQNNLAHRTQVIANPKRKSSEVSPICSLTFLSARFHPVRSFTKLKGGKSDESRALQCRAKAHGGDTSDFAPERKLNFSNALMKFLRPYSLISTFTLYVAYMGRTFIDNPNMLNWSLFPKAVAILVAILSTSCFNIGINQIYDIDIDRINKPNLALTSGDLTLESCWLLVKSYIIIGISASAFLNSGLFSACMGAQFFIAYLYSAPPIRLKQSSFGALLAATVSSVLKCLCLASAARFILGLPFKLSLPMLFFTTSVAVFYGVVSVLKDLPDVEGDSRFGVKTFASMIGMRNTAFLGSGILLLNNVCAIIIAIYNPQDFRRLVIIPAHISMASSLVFQVWKLEKANYKKEASQAFFLFLWKLLDAACIVFPFI